MHERTRVHDQDFLALPLDSSPGREYDERAFLYFLGVERARAERANRVVRLVLASLEANAGRPAAISAANARRLFAGLRTCVRETDVMGWYCQDLVAAAVLSEPGETNHESVSRTIGERVVSAVCERLNAKSARCLRVRVLHFAPGSTRGGGE